MATAAKDGAETAERLRPPLDGFARSAASANARRVANRHFNRGNALLARGECEAAGRCYRRALALLPDDPELWSNLGCALWRMRRLEQAAACLGRALALRPDYAQALSNLGGVLEELGRAEDALAHYQKALEISPAYATAHSNLGRAFLRLGRLDDAVRHYLRALELNPAEADSYSNLAAALAARRNVVEAQALLQRALELAPNHVTALSNLGDVLRIQGKLEQAAQAYSKAAALEPGNWGRRVKLALVQPIVIESAAAAMRFRERMADSLETLVREGVELHDPHREVGITNFYLAYQGLNDAPIQSRLARFYLSACPRLEWTAPHCAAARKADSAGRLRLGIVSSCLRDHTIGKFYHGIIERLSRERFELVLFRPPHEDAVAAAIDRAVDRVVEIPRELYPARERIAAERPDILFYPEIGMDPLIYFTAFARLAPVQCVSWGHPVTSGIPSIDYFLSTNGLEPAGAEAHYTEQLIRFRHLLTYYARPRPPATSWTRAQLGFPDDATIYMCPQSLFKFHPDFDAALAAILRGDPKARLLLLAGDHAHWGKVLSARIAKSFPDVTERIIFLPRLPQAEFLRALSMADVLLDTPYFGGGNTTYEALALGLPIVTWPGPFMRGRVTAACYWTMGIEDLVAPDLEAYAGIALRLGRDKGWRQRISAEIASRAGMLYEDDGAVSELETFFVAAWEASLRGEKIPNWGTE